MFYLFEVSVVCIYVDTINMQECGPRFTLKLISLQHGTFDTKGGEYEWVHKVVHLPTKSGCCFVLMIYLAFCSK